MQTIDLESLIANAAPVSPGGGYTLRTWPGRSCLAVFDRADDSPVLAFREEHGEILRAGFSPDMRQLLAWSEDGSVSVWFLPVESLAWRKPPANIVDFMLCSDRVPYLLISPGPSAAAPRQYSFSMRDSSDASFAFYDWLL